MLMGIELLAIDTWFAHLDVLHLTRLRRPSLQMTKPPCKSYTHTEASKAYGSSRAAAAGGMRRCHDASELGMHTPAAAPCPRSATAMAASAAAAGGAAAHSAASKACNSSMVDRMRATSTAPMAGSASAAASHSAAVRMMRCRSSRKWFATAACVPAHCTDQWLWQRQSVILREEGGTVQKGGERKTANGLN